MLLAVDVGNTNIVLGIHDGASWKKNWRISTDTSKMPDEYGVLVRDLLREGDVDRGSIFQAVISSVVPGLTGKMREMVREMTGFEPLIVGPGVKTGLKILIENPAELGTDIVCNSVAAYNRIKGNCIVVDFGTALTFSAIREPGRSLVCLLLQDFRLLRGPVRAYGSVAPGLAGTAAEGPSEPIPSSLFNRCHLGVYGTGGVAD